MEKLIENLVSIFSNDNEHDVKIDKDEKGNTTIFISRKRENKELQQIRKEIEDLDDNIFEEAAAKLKETNPTAFQVMTTLEEEAPNMDNIRVAYKIFKAIVKEIVEFKIKEYTEEVNRLFNKYLGE